MNQQIKSNNKNNKNENDLIPIKLAFQANIFKYVQKKKRQLSVFATLKQKYNNTTDKNSSTLSNLINRNTEFSFYKHKQSNRNDHQMLLSTRIKLFDRKSSEKQLMLDKKIKGHKANLSDWRILYDQRNNIAEKMEMKNNSPDKMIATDRLFYPCKIKSNKSIQKNCSKHDQKQLQRKIKDKNNVAIQNKFVSDQNFFHMYHRSVTPILSDKVEKKRIIKYLKQNKQRRQSRHGLRLMNEGIFSDITGNDVGFVQYKHQQIVSKSKLYPYLDPDIKNQIIQVFQSQFKSIEQDKSKKNIQTQEEDQNKSYLQSFLNGYRSNQNKKQANQLNEKEIQNPQIFQNEKNDERFVNISELFSKTIGNPLSKRRQNKQFRLKYFKQKQNKIQKGIYNAKQIQSQNKFANFQYNLPSPKHKHTSKSLIKNNNIQWAK